MTATKRSDLPLSKKIAKDQIRATIIDDIKRYGQVGYFVEWPEGFGAFIGSLHCRACFDGMRRREKICPAIVTPIGYDEACALALREDEAPLCDACGHDIRNPKES